MRTIILLLISVALMGHTKFELEGMNKNDIRQEVLKALYKLDVDHRFYEMRGPNASRLSTSLSGVNIENGIITVDTLLDYYGPSTLTEEVRVLLQRYEAVLNSPWGDKPTRATLHAEFLRWLRKYKK